MGQQHQQLDESGRCALHPGIQLHHKKKNGEWRVLLNACPLCVSGLPATGQSISTPGGRTMGEEIDQQQQQQQHLEDAEGIINTDYGRKESKDSKKKKKKHKHHHKHKSPRRPSRHEHDDDENSLGEASQTHISHGSMGGNSAESNDDENQRDNHQQQSVLDEKIAKKIHQKKSKKHRNKESSTGRSGSTGSRRSVSGSRGGRRREKSATTPPAARPRSPSPQSPAQRAVAAALAEQKYMNSLSQQEEVANAMANNENVGGDDDHGFTPQFKEETREKYNEFLQFLDRDAQAHQQDLAEQQQDEYNNNFCQQTSEQQDPQQQNNNNKNIRWDDNNGGNGNIIMEQPSIDRSEYSAAGTIDHSMADTVSQGAISTEDEGFYTTEDDTSDMDESMSHLSRHSAISGSRGNGPQVRFDHQLQPDHFYGEPQQQQQQQPRQSQYQNVHQQFQDTNQQFQNMNLHQQQNHHIHPSQQDYNPPPYDSMQQQPQSHHTQHNYPANMLPKQPSGPLAGGDNDDAPQDERRPDPEDVDEFYEQNMNHGMYHPHQGQYQAHHMSHNQPRHHQVSRGGYNLNIPQGGPDPQMSNQGYPQQEINHLQHHQQQHPHVVHDEGQQMYPSHDNDIHDDDNASMNDNASSNGSGSQPQHHQPSNVLEQDDVSMMSMGSVTRNMYKLHAQQALAAQKNQQLHGGKLKEANDESDDSSSSSSSEDETNTNRSSTGGTDSNKQSSTIVAGNNSTTGGEINTCDFDERGWCRHHPTVRLRKKKLLKGWVVVLSNCPECTLDEMRRIKDSRRSAARRRKKKGTAGSSGGSRVSGVSGGSSMGSSSRGAADSKQSRETRDSKKKKSKKHKKKHKKDKKKERSSKNPPISQVDLRTTAAATSNNGNDGGKAGREDFDDTRSVGTASTITISSYTHSSTGGRWQNYADGGGGGVSNGASAMNDDVRSVGSGSMNDNHSVGSGNGGGGKTNSSNNSSGATTAHVTRMPYTDQYGENGWYTGHVDPSSGVPHGTGMMNYANGAVHEGEWSGGVSLSPSKTREEPIMPGGGGSMGASGGGGYGPPRGGGGMPGRRHRQPQPHHQHNIHMAGQGGRSYLATLNEDGSDYEYDGTPSSSSSVPRGSSLQRSMSPTPPPVSQERKVVCGMAWTDMHGNTGSYTGEVNYLNIPNGMGSMRYDERGGHRGIVAEGMWRDGEMDFDDDDDYDSESSSDSDSGSTYVDDEEEDGVEEGSGNNMMSAPGNSNQGGNGVSSYGMASAVGGSGIGY